MGTRRYGISPWVFNSIAHESDIDLNTRRELITYLQETMYSIVFYINTVGLYWQEKSTLLINKKHRIHNPRKKSRKARRQFSATRLKMKKRFESVQKQTMAITFNLLVTRPKSANGKFSTCRFFFSAAFLAAEKKAKATKYQTFGCFFLPLLGNFERHYLWAIQIFQGFSSHNPRNFDKGPWIENGERFTILSSTCQSGAKVEWRVSSSEYCWIIPANNC